MPRSSKDIAKRLRFELTPRGYVFRRLYLALGLLACAAALGVWWLTSMRVGERQYLPGPVTAPHATFGARCEACHTQAFREVSNDACLQCHAPGIHTKFEKRTPACVECHLEHRGSEAIRAASSQPCIACHAALESSADPARIAAQVPDFASHPPFVPLRQGFVDGAALRFDHRKHLETDKILAENKLDCPSCHVADDTGRRMRPILFETHCRKCHTQNVPGPLGDLEVVHGKSPDAVRADLAARLLAMAVADPQRVFGDADFFLPGRRRGPIDQSKDLVEFRDKWLGGAEAMLYQPFDATEPLAQNNKYCFLCHLAAEGVAAPGLPNLQKTNIPARWLERGEFSHRAHESLKCEACHDQVAASTATAQVNLPGNQLCRRCHVDGAVVSAGTECVLCHVYHERGGHPQLPLPRQRQRDVDVFAPRKE